MKKFLAVHTLSPRAFTRDQVNKFAEAGQSDPVIRGYRSFMNLSEGKAVCVIEGPNKEAVATWFQKMGMPYDSITPLELEGDRGAVKEV